MSMNPEHLRELIQMTLRALDPEVPYREDAVELLMLTAAAESDLGTYLRQVSGPARGIYQMEPNTEKDIWWNYLCHRRKIADAVSLFLSEGGPMELDLMGNIPYQTAMARIHYLRVPAPLPIGTYVQGMAIYWKAYYNTRLGAGKVEEAVQKYNRFVKGKK